MKEMIFLTLLLCFPNISNPIFCCSQQVYWAYAPGTTQYVKVPVYAIIRRPASDPQIYEEITDVSLVNKERNIPQYILPSRQQPNQNPASSYQTGPLLVPPAGPPAPYLPQYGTRPSINSFETNKAPVSPFSTGENLRYNHGIEGPPISPPRN